MREYIFKENEDKIADIFEDNYGFWAYLYEGYIFNESQGHTLHLEDKDKFISALNGISECKCFECGMSK